MVIGAWDRSTRRKNNSKNLNNLICIESKQKQNPNFILIGFSLSFGYIYIYIYIYIYYLVSNGPYIVI